MARPRKYDDKAEGYAAQNARRRYQRSNHPVRFIAVDGEGVGSGSNHKYVLLGVGQAQTTNPDGLQFGEILRFLYDYYTHNPDNAYIGFYLGYDFTQWFKTLPENRAWYLLSPEGIARRQRRSHQHLGPFPVKYDGWEFDVLGMKRFRFRPEGERGWMNICDAGPFFQASFISVIDPAKWNEPVVSEAEYAKICEGKARRDTAVLDNDMRTYNGLENAVLARVMERLNTGLVQTGVRLKKNQWFGPGQAAQSWLSATAVPASDELSAVPSSAQEAGRLTYYGGWFEIFAHGHIPGITWEYDINSAYPAIAARLPCLLHGTWTNGLGVPGNLGPNDICAVYATVRGNDKHLGAMLHRTPEGTIRRPNATRGWYWKAEIDAAVRCRAITNIEYHEWVSYEPCACPPPMVGLLELYNRRLLAGKNSPLGKALKLIYNSVYGKLAQSVGNPEFGNAIYASLITSGCRTMILDAIHTHPEGTSGLLMVATDGVYFRTRHPNLKISEQIGEWSVSQKENLTLFKPGVYWDDSTRAAIRSGNSPVFRARGISAKSFAAHIQSIDSQFSDWGNVYPSERDPEGPRDGWYPRVIVHSMFSMVTCQQALQRGKWHLAGSLGHEPNPGCPGCDGAHLIQDSDPVLKRHSGAYRDGIYWSQPYPDSFPFESQPYNKRFGQSDPDEYGITDDGTVLDSWKGCYQV